MNRNNIDSGKIGQVIEVNTERVIVEVSNELDNYNIIHNGTLHRVGQVGSFVKIINGLCCVYCVVESFSTYMQTGDIAINKKVINVSLLGYKNINGEFESGAKITPSIADSVFLIDEDDINIIFKSDVKFPVEVGKNYFSNSLPVYLNLNEFVLKHSLIVGSTGSGKSNTVAYLLNNITTKYKSSRIIIIDIHGEYMKYLGENAYEFSIYDPTKKLVLPYWMLDFDILCRLFGLGNSLTSSSIIDVFRDRILQMKKEFINGNDELKSKIKLADININSPIPFNIKTIWFEFYKRGYGTFNNTSREFGDFAYMKADNQDDLIGKAEELIKPVFKPYTSLNSAPFKSNESNYKNIADNIENLLRNEDFKFVFGDDEYIKGDKGIAELIESWIENDKQISVLNLSGIPYNILDVVIGVLSNLLFDTVYYTLKINAKKFEGRPLLICYEEAHRYLNSGTQNSFSQNAVERIMKEGRKFGLGAMIISQRPVEIPNTVISQVSTFIALRLTNSDDQSRVISFAPNNFSMFLKSLPSLGNGDAFVIGESMKIPMKVKIPLLETVKNINFAEKIGAWNQDRPDNLSYNDTVISWMQK
ncbi:ATP-binding protein [Pedobacter aquae]|uniref:ATP-binding protein n=1 Tax=Pedobacter aquae TaxID=2605747 RepID=A0A5C0VES7_9SPHI|nr:ATP-binding protein [Pedobacter aquae]QEK50343.1 ATP-binding protein [Pedobacter aquae]